MDNKKKYESPEVRTITEDDIKFLDIIKNYSVKDYSKDSDDFIKIMIFNVSNNIREFVKGYLNYGN